VWGAIAAGSTPRRRAHGERLSWHSLRHSALSILATDVALLATTLARIAGHTNPATTFGLYARDGRDDEAFVADALAAAEGSFGG